MSRVEAVRNRFHTAGRRIHGTRFHPENMPGYRPDDEPESAVEVGEWASMWHLALGVCAPEHAGGYVNGQPIYYWDLFQASHMLVVGETNFGKTSMLRSLAAQAAHLGWGYAIGDGKGAGDFVFLRGRRGLWTDPDGKTIGIEDASPDQVAKLVRLVREEVERRYADDLARKIAISNNEPSPTTPPPPVLFIVDEFLGVGQELGKNSAAYWKDLGIIARKARQARVHGVFATQRPDISEGMKGETRAQVGMRVSIGPMDDDGRAMAHDNKAASGIVTPRIKGRAAAGPLGTLPVGVQTFWLADPLDDQATEADRRAALAVLPPKVTPRDETPEELG